MTFVIVVVVTADFVAVIVSVVPTAAVKQVFVIAAALA